MEPSDPKSVKKGGYIDCSAAPTELPSGRYGLSQFFGMGVMTYAHQKSHLDPVYIPLVRRARQLTRKIMPYAVINGSFDVIKSLALNIDPRFTEEQVSLVIAGAFTAMGEIRRLQGGKPMSMYHWTLPRARKLPTAADSTVGDGAVQPSQSHHEHGVPEILLEGGYRTDGRSPEAVSSPSSAQQPLPPKTASKPKAVTSKKQMYEERGYKVTAKPRSVVVNPLNAKAPVAAAAALPHQQEPLVPPSTVMDSAQPPQLSQRPSCTREETESTSSESTVQGRRLGRARSHESVMPRQPREPRWNLEKIDFRPPDIPLRGGYPVLRKSRPVRGQVESRQFSRSSSREDPPSRKRYRHESGDSRDRADPREVPQTFSARDMREIRGMLRSRGPGGLRRRTPGSAEVGPHAGNHLRHGNQPCHAVKYGRMQYEEGYREDRSRRAPHPSNYWLYRQQEKRMKYRE